MLFKELYEKSGWIAPSKIAKRSLKPQRKEPRSLTLNEFLIETLKKEIPKNKRSAFIDKILSEHFGIKYEEAYPGLLKKVIDDMLCSHARLDAQNSRWEPITQ